MEYPAAGSAATTARSESRRPRRGAAGYSAAMELDPDRCWDRLAARDARFDGTFFVGVTSTGIYCRPVCPARTPARERCTFFAEAASAEAAGFRACRRCRPERAPGHAPVDARSRLVRRALARIEGGALDHHKVGELAAELGVGERQLRRVFTEELGVSPLAWASTRRAALARQLLADPAMPATVAAEAAGFGSVRRMREVVGPARGRAAGGGDPTVWSDARPPFDAAAIAGFLGARSVPGVEVADASGLRRLVTWRGHLGVVRVTPAKHGVAVSVPVALAGALPQLLARVRRTFDLDCRPDRVDGVLGDDPTLAPLVRSRPGTRLPAAFEPFELAVRAIVGQQVSVRAATTLAGRVAAAYGTRVPAVDGLDTVFPTPEALAAASIDDVARLGLPGRRAAALVGLAQAVADERVDLGDGADPEEVERALLALPGIGPWTASYVVMRGLGFPDRFPAGDLGLRKALGGCTAREAERRAEAWRPYRSYAAMVLWGSLATLGGPT